VPAVTAETSQLRRSPLAHRAGELAAQTGGVMLAELPFLSMVNLRVTRSASGVADRVEQALGVALPGPGLVATLGERSVLWLGPDEWLVVGPDGGAAGLVGFLGAAIGDGPGSVVDVSANRDTLVISGPAARELLEKGCTLDLHPRAFGAGRCAQTTFARGHILIWQTADEAGQKSADEASEVGPVYRLLFRGSFADYFADWLIDAAAEFRD
jgi:sarcosine oxidase, subunit gamma